MVTLKAMFVAGEASQLESPSWTAPSTTGPALVKLRIPAVIKAGPLTTLKFVTLRPLVAVAVKATMFVVSWSPMFRKLTVWLAFVTVSVPVVPP